MDKNNTFFIIILYDRSKSQPNNEITFKERKALVQIIYSDRKDKDKFNNQYIVVLKYIIKEVKSKIKFDFNINKDKYILEFDTKEKDIQKNFIYSPNLTFSAEFTQHKKPISQTTMRNYEKMNIIYSILNKENDYKEMLPFFYKDTIQLYKKSPNFEFLINIFIKVYNNLDICKMLFKEFKLTLEKESQKNSITTENLKKLKDIIREICDKIENTIQKFQEVLNKSDNNSDIYTDYYGLILCYLNNYDLDYFTEIIKHLYAKDPTILFQILLTYKSYFKNDIKVDEKILIEFIEFTAGRTYKELTENGLVYLKNLKLFLKIVEINKKKIIENENFKPLGLNNIKNNKIQAKDMNEIIQYMRNIIEYSEENKKILVSFNDIIWVNLIEKCSSSTKENIMLLSDLKEIFDKYFYLVTTLFKSENEISKNAKNFEKKDRFNTLLDKNIKEYLKKEKDISNDAILSLIMEVDPIYKIDKDKPEKNVGKRDYKILDYIDFHKIDEDFKKSYKSYNIEKIFKKDIGRYLTNLFNKVENWENFVSICDLINIDNLERKNDYINLINTTYKRLCENKKNSLSELSIELLNNVVETLADLSDFMYLNNNDFYSTKISKLNKEIRNKIYNKLITFCTDEKHKTMKEYIKDFYLKRITNEKCDFEEFVTFIQNLKYDDKIDVMDILNNKYQISSDDFYLGTTNKKINLLSALIDKNALNEENENKYYNNCVLILKEIYGEIADDKYTIKQLKSLFSDKVEINIKNKLKLFKLLKEENIDENELYDKLKDIHIEINNKLNVLNYIVINLEKYYNKIYEKNINDIKAIVKKIEEGTKEDYDNELINLDSLLDKKKEADQVNKVKDLKLFAILYKNTNVVEQDKRFKNALEKLNNIRTIMKSEDKDNKKIFEEIRRNNNQIDEEIKKYFDEKNSDDELSLLFHFDSYEKDIKSIFYFFDNFHKDENWNKILCPKYKEISQKNMVEYLKELKEKQIYDYEKEKQQNKSNYIRLFNCLYKKQEAYDFLNQKHDNIGILYEKLDPNIQTLKASDIEAAIACVDFFSQINKKETNKEIFDFLKEKLNENRDLVEKFEIYSEVYPSIIELYQNFDDFSVNLYDKVAKILKELTIIFYRKYDEINLKQDKEEKDIIKSIDDLLTLKNKIHVKSKMEENYTEKEETMIKKYNTLNFFKDNITNIGIIYKYITFLRTKGCVLPICIKIEIRDEPEKTIKYFLYDHNDKPIEKTFEQIEKFLSDIKTEFIKQLELFYNINDYMRFIYGKQIVSIVEYLDGLKELFPFLRYILNDTDSEIKEGKKLNVHDAKNYIKNYSMYIKETLTNISNYILSLLQSNNLSLEKHYGNMIINDKDSNSLKGIYFYKSESESMEEDILQIFLDKINILPIAQNILITNKETSYEEMQAFLSRAILCRYNTIFIIEINESFNENQQRHLNKILNKLLSYKLAHCNIEEIDKTSEYMESCLIFIYNKKNESALTFIKSLVNPNELQLRKEHKLDNTSFMEGYSKSENSRIELNKNVHVIKSEICGLGKTTKIKNYTKNKKYIHFPIGGNINRNILYRKLENVLDKIEKIIISEKEAKQNITYKDFAIHLDLYENNETSILNEFLFSFLITKFYSNSENIIYISKDIEIYVEVPNCFEDFLSKYKILSSFDIEIIKLEAKPELNLEDEKLLHFKHMLETEDIHKISDFINNFIGIEKYSYHQANIFINLFISQYSKFKIKGFMDKGKDVTRQTIENFAKCTNYFNSGAFANLLTNKDEMEKINGKDKEYKKVLSKTYQNDLENLNFDTPLIFIESEEYRCELYISKKKLDEELEKFRKKPENKDKADSYYFLKKLKYVLNLETDIESLKKIIDKDEYVITYDNFRKMILIIYRIVANIPVIIMGETGCGKTTLIRKLNQLINNGEENLEIVNIHPGITDEILIEKMKEINKKAEELKDKDLWVFFDELNTCDSLALLNEIFINRSFVGEKIAKNIKLLAACNPYRINEKNKVKCGLSRPSDQYDELVYLVKLLPQSLMYYVFNFGSISEEDEDKYIRSIISKHFDKNEEILKEKTKNIISACHKFLKKEFDSSIVSLRDISRFTKFYKFFIDYYKKKNKINNQTGNEEIEKIKSIILSIYICYYIRLTDKEERGEFDNELQQYFIELIDWNPKFFTEKNQTEGLFNLIKNNLFIEDIKKNYKIKLNKFSEILDIEEEYILNKIELGKGIGNNKSLRTNLFLVFVSLITNIPLIIIGKPGSGKSLSSQLIYKSMRGKYSTNDFFKLYPSIIQSYFQGSDSTTPEDVENIFKIAEGKLESFKNKKNEDPPISMLLFDELGLAERSKSNPLKVLHSKLDEYFNEHIQNNNNENNLKVCFIGITNWSLDAAKLNRAISLSVPDLDEVIEDLEETSTTIAKSFNEDLADKKKVNDDKKKENKVEIFETLLPNVYYNYKQTLKKLKLLTVKKEYDKENPNNKNNLNEILNNDEFKKLVNKDKKIKVDFHGNRDFFNLIKGTAKELNETNEINDIESVVNVIEKYIERNFGGMELEIDINEKDIYEDEIYILKLLELNEKKITSVKFFKCIYNTFIESDNNKNIYENFKLKNVDRYDIIKCIYDNIKDINSRYILLVIKQSVAYLIQQNIKKEVIMVKENVPFEEGSPFENDEGMEYQYRKLNDIQEYAKKNNLLFLQNLKQIYPYLYDVFNMNYIIKDGKTYARICHGNYSDQLALINPLFRIIIMVNKKFMDKMETPFLSRFEKIIIKFNELLNDTQKLLADDLMKNECDFKNMIKKKKYHLNYSVNDLLIGCNKEDIQGLVYNFSQDINISDDNRKNDIKTKVISKLVKLLPQDIIVNLPEKEKIKEEYFRNKKFYNLEDYICDNNENIPKISIIYTFNNIADNIQIMEQYGESIFISDIKSENDLWKKIQTDINKKTNKIKRFIYLRFTQSNSQKLSFVVNNLENKFKEDNIKFICIIHAKRIFDKNEMENDKKVNDKNLNDKKEIDDKIYTIPNLNNDVEQLFIDNLEKKEYGDNNETIKLNDILGKSVSDLLKNIDLKKQFWKTLRKFINYNLGNNSKLLKGENDNINQDNYLNKLEEYLKNDQSFIDHIIEKAKSFIEFKGEDLIKEIYDKNYITKNSTDIISIIFDFIGENLISEKIIDIFYNLEDNNFFTSLLVLNNQNNELINNEILEDLKMNYIKELKYKQKERYDLKFDLNFVIPGFYNIYGALSDIISKNYSGDFMKNEKKLREFKSKKGNKDDAISNFYDKESELIDRLSQEMQNDDNQSIFNMMYSVKIPENIFLDDYITFYLNKYYNDNKEINNNISCYLSYGHTNHKIIKCLLKLRFKKYDDTKDENTIELIKKICWIESNINYIIDILQIYKELKDNFGQEEKLFEIMEKNIDTLNIKYITDEQKNPEITGEVNECYYLVLASIIYSVFPPNYDFKNKKSIELTLYIDTLKGSLKILQNLNDNLHTYLNEIYIIDEFIKIYETLEKNNKINLDLLKNISEVLRKYSEIIQDNNQNYSVNLIENFKKLYELITTNLKFSDQNYYPLLKTIFFKEIKKIEDIDYRTSVFTEFIKENEVIKSSSNIFQILLKSLINPGKGSFEKSIKNLLDDKSEIIQIIENILSNNNENNCFSLTETLLYFFEKNSLIYLDNIITEKNKEEKNKEEKNKIIPLEEEPLSVFKSCIKNLDEFLDKKKHKDKNKNICKLFSIGYIKTFCYNFINYLEKDKISEPLKIINEINEKEKVSKIITLYIYKIIYNKNNKEAYLFSIDAFKEKYKLSQYKDFKDFTVNADDDELSNQLNLDKDYEDIFDTIQKYKFEKFKNVNIDEFKPEEIDKFYFASSNLILKLKDFEKSETYVNFYNNICNKLYKSGTKISSAIKLFYDPKKYEKIKKDFEINGEVHKILLYSYRYCLNEINSNSKTSIFSLFYDKSKIKDINKYYYPGNDIKNNQIYDVYIKILNHFKNKQKQACFICMCEKAYYYSTRDEEPNEKDLNNTCPYCGEPVGSKKEKTRTIPVKRENYFRILLSQEEYDYKKKREFNEYDYITLDDFKEKYVNRNLQDEKGIIKVDENHLKRDNKLVRDLSQVSYRLLNFILYSHLFFGKLYTEDKSFDDKCLPKTTKGENMKWGKLMTQLWELLKMELNNNGVNSIEIFMNYIFADIFKILNNNTNIKEYQSLKKIERTLNIIILDKIQLFKKDYKNKKIDDQIDQNDKHFIYNLIKEKFTNLESDDYPFYQYFFYSDYIDEDYLLELVNLYSKDKYPVLLKALERKNEKKNKDDKIKLTKLELFNFVLNLFNEKYSFKISREEAKKRIIKDEELYKENSKKVDDFIKFYNSLNMKDSHKNEIKLDIENKLSNLFVEDNTDMGKSFKQIYQKFIEKQNNELIDLLEIKIDKEIFDKNCLKKVEIQNINENEIFTLKLPKNFSFIDIIFNHSCRKTLIDNDYKMYNQFEIDLDGIEETMCEILLKNKKLLNDNIINFIYKNEDLSFENSDIITIFNKNYNTPIDLNDKVILYKFYEEKKTDINLLVGIIEDFNQLIMFLNNNINNNKISDKIGGKNDIANTFEFLGDKITDKFKEIFKKEKKENSENNQNQRSNNLTIGKTTNLFLYYLRLIFDKIIKTKFQKYQINKKKEDIDEKKRNKIKKYFDDDNNHLIKKEIFRNSIRLLITLFLYKNDNEQKIKENKNNIVNYLNIKDIWVDISTNKSEFLEELRKIKKLNIQLNQILAVYDLLTCDKDDEKYYNEVEKEIEKTKKIAPKEEPIEEDSDKTSSDDESQSANDDSDKDSNKSDSEKSDENEDD